MVAADLEGDAEGQSPEKGEGDVSNAVSLLQEFIQSCSSFSPNTKILTWSFEQQLENATSLQFRATVSFTLAEVPYYFCGGWQTSKKKAQRDTAERVRHYLARRFDQQQAQHAIEHPEASADTPTLNPPHAVVEPESIGHGVIAELEALCGRDGALDAGGAQNCVDWELEARNPSGASHSCRARMTVSIHGVPHTFRGDWSATADSARLDLAKRVLWYFGAATAEEAFSVSERNSESVPSPSPPQMAHLSSPARPSTTAPDGDTQQAVEDKTILMQIQNALQKTFAKDTPPGQRVWVWSYEADPNDPQLFRAFVDVPCWNQRFVGDWCRGKKLAQRNACIVVKDALDKRLSPEGAS